MPKNSPQTITGSSVFQPKSGKQPLLEHLRRAEGRPLDLVSFVNYPTISGIAAVILLLLLVWFDLQAPQCRRMLESVVRKLVVLCTVFDPG